MKRKAINMKYPDDFINKIICADHLNIIKYIPDNIIDLTVTSPPYDNLRDYDGYNFYWEKLIPELFRITKQGGVVVWIVGDQTINGSETGTSFKQALFFMKTGFNLHDTMIYEKTGIQYPDITRYYNIFEYMFIFSKGKPKTINLISDRINKEYGSTIHGTERGKDGQLKQNRRLKGKKIKLYGVRFNIWKYKTGKNNCTKDCIAYEHSAIFPDLLIWDHMRTWSNEGDIIFDPMCGSGTVCKVAKFNNRKYIGIDCSEKYCEIVKERCGNTLWDDFS
jgi:site-specific DNA-methyltransferase (adenine-specific)